MPANYQQQAKEWAERAVRHSSENERLRWEMVRAIAELDDNKARRILKAALRKTVKPKAA